MQLHSLVGAKMQLHSLVGDKLSETEIKETENHKINLFFPKNDLFNLTWEY